MDLECQCHIIKEACVHGSYKSQATRQLRDDDGEEAAEREREADKNPRTMQAITRL